jgi:hypothetical protein
MFFADDLRIFLVMKFAKDFKFIQSHTEFDERAGLFFVSHSHLSVCTFNINIFVFHAFIVYTYAHYNTYNIYNASF